MQRKRKLTSVFSEIPRERESLRRSWRTGEHSDWVLVLGPEEFTIHKVIVATGDRASAFLAASFREHCGKRECTDLTELIPRPCWPHFPALLDFSYNEQVGIAADSWGSLLKMADLLQVGALYNRCVEAGDDLIDRENAPRIVADAVQLQIGGDLQQEVVQAAIDVMVPHFSSYSPKDLVPLPLQVFQALLQRDDLDVATEDHVFDFLQKVSTEIGQSDMVQLWKCCRLHLLSAACVLDIAHISEISKEDVVWAFAQHGAPVPSPAATQRVPAWAAGRPKPAGPRGQQIVFVVHGPAGYAPKRSVRSTAHQLCERFRWRLLVFPLGTESTGTPRQVAAFVEIVPDTGLDPAWRLRRVRYAITLVNWADEGRSITKEHVFDFCNEEMDNGWHRGWVTPDAMTVAQGWLSERGELCFRAQSCIKGATIVNADMPNIDLVVSAGSDGGGAGARGAAPDAAIDVTAIAE